MQVEHSDVERQRQRGKSRYRTFKLLHRKALSFPTLSWIVSGQEGVSCIKAVIKCKAIVLKEREAPCRENAPEMIERTLRTGCIPCEDLTRIRPVVTTLQIFPSISRFPFFFLTFAPFIPHYIKVYPFVFVLDPRLTDLVIVMFKSLRPLASRAATVKRKKRPCTPFFE